MAELSAAPRKRRRHRIWLIALVVLLLGLVAVVTQLPRLLIPSLEARLSAALGTPVRLGALSLNPLRGTISARAVQLGEGGEQIRVEQMDVHLVLRRLLLRQVEIERITLDGPQLRLAWDEQGRPRLAIHLPGGPAVPVALPISVQEVLVQRGKLTLQPPGGAPLELHDVEIRLSEVELPGATTPARAHVYASAAVAGGSLLAEGTMAVGGAVNEVQLAGEASRLALGELAPSLGLSPAAGTASVKLAFKQDAKTESLNLSGAVEDARLEGRDGAVLTARRLVLDEAVVDLGKRRVNLGSLQVLSPNLVLAVTAAGVTLPFDFGGTARSDSGSKTGWQVLPGNVHVRQGELAIGAEATALRLRKLDADWAGAKPGKTGPVKATAETDGGGRVTIEGKMGVAPLAGSLNGTIAALNMAAITASLPSLPLPIAKGTLDAEIRADLGLASPRLQGSLNLHSLHTGAPSTARPEEVLAVYQAQCRFELELGKPWTMRMPWLRLQDPYIMIHRHAEGVFPYNLFAGGGAKQAVSDSPTTAGTPPSGLRVQVDRLEVSGGRVELTDAVIDPPFWSAFNIVEGSADQIGATPFAVGRLEISGWHDELSPVKLSGSWRSDVVALNLDVERFYVETLNPYLSPLLGYRATGGLLSLQVDAPKQPWPVSMDNQAVLSGVQLEATGVDAIQARAGIALPIALSLLEGLDRKTRLSAPITVAAGGKIDWGDLVSAAISRAIEGALSWPLKVLGDLFRGRQSSYAFAIEPLQFEEGRAKLDKQTTRRVADIVRVLAAHPKLSVVLQAQITAGDIAAVGEAAAAGLATGRVQTARDALTQPVGQRRVDPSRILIAEWTPKVGAGATGRPSVYVEIQQQ